MPQPFTSIEQFRKQFNQGLEALLTNHQPGTFILCLANAMQDSELFEQLKNSLFKQHASLIGEYINKSAGDQLQNVAQEDLIVLEKIFQAGIENIELTKVRAEFPWTCQFNQLRAFRPKRITAFNFNGDISNAFDETQFHFNKPFLRSECFWHGNLNGKKIDLLYNKYPFADLHGLLVPEREACLPQLLTKEMHEYIWSLNSEFKDALPGIGFGYNSYGAYASVNHLHFQMYVDAKKLPIALPEWKHNGGNENYPVTLFKHTDISASWELIENLHKLKQPYNLLYNADEIYVIPRKPQGEVTLPEWTSGFTWYELSGALLMFSADDYHNIGKASITELLSAHSVEEKLFS